MPSGPMRSASSRSMPSSKPSPRVVSSPPAMTCPTENAAGYQRPAGAIAKKCKFPGMRDFTVLNVPGRSKPRSFVLAHHLAGKRMAAQAPTVLVVDDDPGIAGLIADAARAAHTEAKRREAAAGAAARAAAVRVALNTPPLAEAAMDTMLAHGSVYARLR